MDRGLKPLIRFLLFALLLGPVVGQDSAAGFDREIIMQRLSALPLAGAEDRQSILMELESIRLELDLGAAGLGLSLEEGLLAVELHVVLAERRLSEEAMSVDSFELFDEARLLAQELRDQSMVAYVEWRRSLWLRNIGDFLGAQDCLESALDELDNRRGMGPVLQCELAALQRAAGRWAKTLELLELAEAGLLDLSDGFAKHAPTRCAIYGIRGQTFLDLGLPDRAAPWFQREAQLASDLGDLNLYLAAAIHRCNLLLSIEDFEGVVSELAALKAAPWYSNVDPSIRAQMSLRGAIARLELERESGAGVAQLVETLETLLSEGYLRFDEVITAQLGLADLAIRRKQDALARSSLEACRLEIAGNSKELPAGDPTSKRVQLEALSARLAVESEMSIEALEAHRKELLEALEDLFQRWEDTPLLAGGLAYLHFGNRRQVLSDAFHITLATQPSVEAAAACFELLLDAQLLGTQSRRLELAKPSLEQIASRLGDGLLLSYLSGPDRSHLLVVDGSEVEHHLLPKAIELEALRSNLLEVLRQSPRSDSWAGRVDRKELLAKRSNALRRALIPSSVLERMTDQRPIIIEGLGSLGYLPFEALALKSGPSPNYLGLHHPLIYWPSIPVGVWLGRELEDAEGAEKLLLLADPAVDSEDSVRPALDLGERDLQSITSSWPSGQVESLLGNGASLESLRSSLRRELPAAVQFIVHGTYESSRERPAGLRLAQSGAEESALWCEDVESLAWPRLVILTACGGARGPRRRGGDGLSQLGGAFFGRGARVVVASHVDIALQASLELMSEFHGELRRGRGPAEALLDGRRSLASGSEFEDPFYWALVHVNGAGQAPLFEGSEVVDASSRLESSKGASRKDGMDPRWLALGLLAVASLIGVVWKLRGRKARSAA